MASSLRLSRLLIPCGNALSVGFLFIFLSTPSAHLLKGSEIDHASEFDRYLSQGQFEAAISHFGKLADSNPQDAQARLAQGLSQFLLALQHLGNANYQYGLISNNLASRLPIARLPIPLNPSPTELSYASLRKIIEQFHDDLEKSEAILSKVDTNQVELNFYLGKVRFDFDNDGNLDAQESLWRVAQAINREAFGQPEITERQGNGFLIGVDGADVHWLRGYANLLMFTCDCILAYDEEELFLRCGQLLFPKITSPFRTAQQPPSATAFDTRLITDLIAAIHLMDFKLKDPERLKSAHSHILAMIRESRLCWKLTLAEKDDHHEWIPNPKQTGILSISVSEEIITGWLKVLDEMEAIVNGEKLIPYWREYANRYIDFDEVNNTIPAKGTGVNLKNFFYKPKDFSLVLAIQGSGVEPFLEEGKLSTPEAWQRLTDIFRGNFIGFAIWFN
ncbi:MAG: hypothetical protein RLY14_2247 [Planctomycetota bacterium]|jgi:tetratricopeptide (TPR) repeat protein